MSEMTNRNSSTTPRGQLVRPRAEDITSFYSKGASLASITVNIIKLIFLRSLAARGPLARSDRQTEDVLMAVD